MLFAIIYKLFKSHIGIKMSYAEHVALRKNVMSVFTRANNYNAKNSVKRFYSMAEYKNGKLIEYGIYDYQTKKYVLHDIYTVNQTDNVTEMDDFITRMSKIEVVK